jgi:small subunit ribosomal protein S13
MAAEKEQAKDKSEKRRDERKEGKEEKFAPHQEKRLLNVVRLGETNLDGNRKVESALLGIRGISFSFSKIITDISGLGKKKVSELSEQEIHNIEDIINHPEKYNVPSWLYNRRKAPESGENKHITTSQLELTHKMDIDRLKKIRSYKGIRHMMGLPVRGQRTRSSFRKGSSVGVQRKARAAASKQSK